MKNILFFFGLIVMGLFMGGISALWMSGLIGPRKGAGLNAINVDNWVSDWSIGSSAADGYTRARVARFGLLGLAKSEAVYFIRSVDEDGAPLRGECSYSLRGGSQDARWWSITLYDENSRLPMNTDGALSIDATQVGDDENWRAAISPWPQASGNWLSSRGAETFDLTLRLYQPSQAILENPEATLNAPTVRKIKCNEAAS